MKINKQKGQALLVVVLVMVVALTVGLSLTARSIIDIRTSTEEADSLKALAAAEAGIEQALQTTDTAPIAGPFTESNTTYSTTITEVKGTSAFLTNGGNLVLQDDGVDIWLVPHNPDGTPDYSSTSWTGDINIYWGDPSLADCDNAAIEVAVISGTKELPSLDRYVYDPCASRRKDNNFSTVGGGGPYSIEGKNLLYKEKIGQGLISSGLIARVVPIYANALIAVDGDGSALPNQGFSIDATGIAGAGDRQVKHSLNFFRTFNQVPTTYFMYGLFSP